MIIGLFVILGMSGWAIWEYCFRQYPLSHFGIVDLHKAAKYEPYSWREEKIQVGYLTRYEWNGVVSRQFMYMESILKERRRNNQTIEY